MSGFSADWLARREPHDLRARNPEVVRAVIDCLNPLQTVHITDLACGTGSTLRALGTHLPARQNWRLVDNDLGLLGRASAMTLAKNINVAALTLDLNRDLELALDGPLDLVTTTAFLDLVSEPWAERLTVEIAARSIPLYAALTYDGRIEIAPEDSQDPAIVAAVNEHQATDKGFGPALGSDATRFLIEKFKSVGYGLVQGRSDWVMGPQDGAIQKEIFVGWAKAAREIGALPEREISSWLSRRCQIVESGLSSLRVGHIDFFATPIATR
ncbi:MAG TPA: class I SAM-dependent methyltransferase [Pseudolabrys sp.]|nr:class I SAM-dependent methyltransferase [Pseudolabrys sp.]